MRGPANGDDWFGLTGDDIDVAAAYSWALRPDCGAVVVFSGTVRNHDDGRDDVVALEYEAFDEAAERRFAAIAAEARGRWPAVRRVVVIHRTGRVAVGDSSVVVAVSSAHRDVAFHAARYVIDAVKVAVPIWKRDVSADGATWSSHATTLTEPGLVPSDDSLTTAGGARQ